MYELRMECLHLAQQTVCTGIAEDVIRAAEMYMAWAVRDQQAQQHAQQTQVYTGPLNG